MSRVFNFSAGPAALPEPVLRQAAEEMLDWQGSGMSVMEMSHRGREFIGICEEAEATLRRLLAVPPHFRILFMQGGGLGENAIVPMNLSGGGAVDVVVTGAWSRKSLAEAGKYADARAAADTRDDGHTSLPPPAQWRLRDGAAYVHVCSNETIHGVEMATLPDLAALGCRAPLVVDCSSHVLSRPVDWSRVGLAFAGAQKNVGPAGLTLVFVREDLLGRALAICPSAFDYRLVADNGSMFNTPPTYGIYVAGLVFRWIEAEGGVAEMDRRADARAARVYGCIDGSGGFYVNRVQRTARSRMNLPFFLADERLQDDFLAGAKAAGLVQLKGHKSVGGLRASLYNAMPMAGVEALVDYLADFQRRRG
ncbi:3-phosphoserine/phosphohydroxythreonine transaminase [Piscinibacter sakaiensis]|uniref:Phosphoserine aminotransferase n=1 Tax=Piscinibacter sakaiensis TaxID=1547922 RepID=A0A0K8NZE6_PISS1|nr:3-phosphoserine/phosphohydroxythreonine transaminase [Piscinibacter sakaiensis]GAP35753.1 phosphoserine aminotransferase [Piscinibacter sakaiensis]